MHIERCASGSGTDAEETAGVTSSSEPTLCFSKTNQLDVWSLYGVLLVPDKYLWTITAFLITINLRPLFVYAYYKIRSLNHAEMYFLFLTDYYLIFFLTDRQ